jgi:hypothetical protein
VKKNDTDLLKVRSFGKTSLREVKRKLADMGLSLGMDLDTPPPVEDDGGEEEEGAETAAQGDSEPAQQEQNA